MNEMPYSMQKSKVNRTLNLRLNAKSIKVQANSDLEKIRKQVTLVRKNLKNILNQTKDLDLAILENEHL